MSQTVRFNTRKDKAFFRTLNKRVYGYFKEAGKTTYADYRMIIKTIAMLSIYLLPLVFILVVQPPMWVMLIAVLVMGAGLAGIGMSVMHDANHGAYSRNKWVNQLLGYALNFVGGSRQTWIIQHNLLHHTYTNIPDVDEDLAGGGLIRLSKSRPKKKIYGLQHIYAWFFYGIMTLAWVSLKDIKQVISYKQRGLKANKDENWSREIGFMILTKLFYYGYILVLPLAVLGIPFWAWLVGFLAMHFVAGFILSITFQLAHVVEHTDQYVPNEDGQVDNAWAVHQMNTTANFARKSKVLNWYLGGLNFQVEHHLFPNICHVHYPKISQIVKQTAAEFNVPYYEYPTMRMAIASHYRTLRDLGKGIR